MRPLKNWVHGARDFGWVRSSDKFLHNGFDGYDKIKGWYCAGTDVYSTFKEEVIFVSSRVNGFGSLGKPGWVVITRFEYKGEYYTSLYGHVSTKHKVNDFIEPGKVIGQIEEYELFWEGKIERADHIHHSVHKGYNIPPLPWGYVPKIGSWVNPNHIGGMCV